VKQLLLELPTWGGQRRGAGRQPNGRKAGVSHLRRPELSGREPVHVTVRVRAAVGYLRAQSRVRVIEDAIAEASDRFGMRIVHYSIQGNHLHFLVESEDSGALARGMQGLCIRIARGLNGLSNRHGRVFDDRYHAHVLRTRREAANAVKYVLGNYRHHTLEHLPPRWEDPCSSARPGARVAPPKTWLLRVGWRGT